MTSETPSVDGCRDCRAASEQLVEGAVGWHCMRHGWQQRAVIFADREAEAIRERDEAIAMLRAVEWKAAVELIIGGWGLGCPSCGSPADDLDMSEHYPDCPLDAFLSRFPESRDTPQGGRS